MLRIERILMIALLALALPAFAQRGGGHSGGMGAGGGMNSGHGMSGDHTMGSNAGSNSGAANAGDHRGSMASQSPDQVLSHNTAIASKIKTLTGQDASAACSGFKNLGQCVAAAHVSKNLGISFADLKAKMTGSNPESLGKAIQDLKPSANSKKESKKANKQAAEDLDQNNS